MFQETQELSESEVAATPVHQPRTLSRVLEQLAERNEGEVTVACIREALADRSFATFLVITSLINLLPFPPPSTLILAVPIILVALQMVVGRDTVWLPQFFLRLSLSGKTFASFTTKTVPLLKKMERVVRPRRWPFGSARAAERFVGFFALIFGIFVFIPLPMTNWFPALATAMCGLALSERDGLWLTIGIILGILSVFVVGGGYILGVAAITGMMHG